MASAFSGILAYGFWNMRGLGDLGQAYGQHNYLVDEETGEVTFLGISPGLAGWRWIVSPRTLQMLR